jgi:hypothetical protein
VVHGVRCDVGGKAIARASGEAVCHGKKIPSHWKENSSDMVGKPCTWKPLANLNADRMTTPNGPSIPKEGGARRSGGGETLKAKSCYCSGMHIA